MPKESRLDEKFSVHHRIGVCNKSRANVESESNKMILSVLKHRALNTLVNQSQSPQEQLELFYNKFRKPVLSKTARSLFEDLISMEKVDFYDKSLIKKKR